MGNWASTKEIVDKYEQRFWSYVNKNGPIIRQELGNCWEWTKAIKRPAGYGMFFNGTKTVRAHRYSLLTLSLNIDVDDNGHVCHQCDNPICVRPSHLYLGNITTNRQDAVIRKRTSNGNRVKTKCKNGHDFTSENTRINVAGQRICRICSRKWKIDSRNKK